MKFIDRILLGVVYTIIMSGCSSNGGRMVGNDRTADAQHGQGQIDIPKALLHDGDIAFRRGNSLSSSMVTLADRDGVYSHAGMVRRLDGKWCIIHAVPGESAETNGVERIKCDPIERFFDSGRCVAGAIMRYRGVQTNGSSREAQEMDAMEDAIGKSEMASRTAEEYLHRQIMFDNSYDLDDTTRLYCTEMIYYAYLRHGIDITGGRCGSMPGRPKYRVIYPSDICQREFMETIFRFENR